MKTHLLALPFVASLSPFAAAQLEVGADAPTFTPTEWIHAAPVDLESLRGQVVAFAFVRLEKDDNLFWLEEWDELRRRFALDPVTFFAVTNESPAYVRETCATERIETPFVIDPADEAARAFDVQLHPSVMIVTPAGTIGFHGQPGSRQEIGDAIVERLDGATPFPELGRKSKGVSRLLEKGELKKAIDLIPKLLPRLKEDDPDRRRLADIEVLIAERTARLKRTADDAIEAEDWPRAITALTRLADEHTGLDGAEGASERIEELRADEELAREIAAAIDFARANRYERERNWRAAYKAYDTLAKVHADTKAGARAKDLATFLEGRAKR